MQQARTQFADLCGAAPGEMAGDPKYTQRLLGLGLTEFPLHPVKIQEIKRIITASDIGKSGK